MQSKFLFMAVGLVFFGVLTRMVPHPANFTAIGALALWSTTLFNSRSLAFVIPLFALLLSDLMLGFHSTAFWVYGAFLLIALLSLVLTPQVSWVRASAGSLSASLIFFVISNFGVWTVGGLYPQTSEGLMSCYIMGLPFLKNQIVGDLFYVGLIGVAARALALRRDLVLAKSN